MNDLFTKLKVFVASPGDVSGERERLRRVIQELNNGIAKDKGFFLELIQWQTHSWPGVGDDAQDVINRQIPIPDIFVGILWRRFGTPTKRAESGTVEEFQRAYENWQRYKWPQIMFYFCRRPYFPDTIEDLSQLEKILHFRLDLQQSGVLYWDYQKPNDFEGLVRTHLANVLLEREQTSGYHGSAESLLTFLSHIKDFKSLISNLDEILKKEVFVAMIYIDLDDFDQFNKRWSRDVGDRFLSSSTGILQDVVRYKGVLSRVSGDEFIAVMPNYTTKEALATAQRMLAVIRSITPGIVTASAGVVSTQDVDPHDKELLNISLGQKLLRLSRQEMQAAKLEGKNRVLAFPSSEQKLTTTYVDQRPMS